MIEQDENARLYNLPTQVRRQVIQEGIVGTNLNKAPNPYSESPVTPFNFPPTHDERPVLRKVEPQIHADIHYNTLYDSLRTTQGWRYRADVHADGFITSIPGSPAQAALTLNETPNLRLSRWPGGVQCYYVLTLFSICPLNPALTGTGGTALHLIDNSGQSYPIGTFPGATAFTQSFGVILPNTIVDPGDKKVGVLLLEEDASGAANTYTFQMAFSIAYLLPSLEPYREVEPHEQYTNNNP
jgi:hypothetical protein